jgi:signal transduction histidine kinase
MLASLAPRPRRVRLSVAALERPVAIMTRMTPATPPSTAPSTIEDGRVEHAAPQATADELGRSQPRRRLRFGIRARMLVGYVGLLAVLVVASVVVARQVLIDRLEEHLDQELTQEVREVRVLSGGFDPRTGERFDSIRRVFEVFLARNIPTRNEAVITLVNGEVFERSRPAVPTYLLDEDQELIARWASVRDTDRGEIDTPGGRVMYWAEPLRRGGELGTFVVAIFRDREEEALNDAIAALAIVGGVFLLAGTVLAWRLAGGVLRPVRAVTATARSISETSLERRIAAQGSDEIAQLAETFNEMLDRLQQAFATQRRFLDDAGHELRTPLTIVSGHLELLEDDPDARQRTLELVLDELERMGRMVSDLLLLARSDQPRFLRLDLVDIAALTDELHAKASALGSRDWRIDGAGRRMIVADRQRLTQAVMQLARNAVQHTEEGAEIGIGSAASPDEARFWVRDTGSGVPAEDCKRIFERFERGANAGGEGAGLGLAIVSAIARAHGGRIALESSEEGATFTIVVPTDQPTREGLPE